MHKELHIRHDFLVCLILTLVTLIVYWQVRNHAFQYYDDNDYVTENHHVQSGLSLDGLAWAFTSTDTSNWHPLTWLSHMVASEIYGLDPGGHHVTSLLFHVINTLLLFIVLKRMTLAIWQSAFVAALFAVHPLHAESVAWVAERKDVLSTFFWFATMWAYVGYVERPGLGRYSLVMVLFALGLMAKPMLVTLPFVLLLMDDWPLGRIRSDCGRTKRSRLKGSTYRESTPFLLVLEKAPLFALSAGSCVVTLFTQQGGGSLPSLDTLPFSVRLANALVSYTSYIGKTVWPARLAVFYPHCGMPPGWKVLASAVFLSAISCVVIWSRKRRPYLAIGWLWYLGTLVPVIGLVQAGEQAMADRYTYVPIIGLFVMIAWGIPELTAKWRCQRSVLVVSAGTVLSVLIICTHFQLRHWENATSLFKRAVNVTANNYMAHANLGLALARQGRSEEAIRHYSEALRINPAWAEAHHLLGNLLARQGDFQAAVVHYSEALRRKPDMAEAHNNLGLALQSLGRLEEAVCHFREALRIKPDYPQARGNLKAALASSR